MSLLEGAMTAALGALHPVSSVVTPPRFGAGHGFRESNDAMTGFVAPPRLSM